MTGWQPIAMQLGTAFMSLLGAVAALPYQLGDIATIIAPEWKARVCVAGFVSAFLLRVAQTAIPRFQMQDTTKPAAKKPRTRKKRKL